MKAKQINLDLFNQAKNISVFMPSSQIELLRQIGPGVPE